MRRSTLFQACSATSRRIDTIKIATLTETSSLNMPLHRRTAAMRRAWKRCRCRFDYWPRTPWYSPGCTSLHMPVAKLLRFMKRGSSPIARVISFTDDRHRNSGGAAAEAVELRACILYSNWPQSRSRESASTQGFLRRTSLLPYSHVRIFPSSVVQSGCQTKPCPVGRTS